MNTKVTKTECIDTVRLKRFIAGETVEEIAETDGVHVRTVESSIEQANRREEMVRQFKLVELKQHGLLENEKLRQRLRVEFGPLVRSALAHLLTGKNSRVVVDDVTGKLQIEEFIDSDVIAQAIVEYRKLTSMEERPATPAPISIQNNVTVNSHDTTIFDFESSIEEIRAQQKAADPETFIDVEESQPE